MIFSMIDNEEDRAGFLMVCVFRGFWSRHYGNPPDRMRQGTHRVQAADVRHRRKG